MKTEGRFKVVEVVPYKRCYATAEFSRRVATLKLENGRYVDLTEDDSGETNFSASFVLNAPDVALIICEGQKMILTASREVLNTLPL